MGGSASAASSGRNKGPATITWAAFSNTGRRAGNEDRWAVASPLVGRDSTDHSASYFGVYDGHNGAATAQKLSEMVHGNLAKQEYFDSGHTSCCTGCAKPIVIDRLAALEGAIIQTDRAINLMNSLSREQSGSTLVSVLVDHDFIYVGNIGDARTVLCRDRHAIQMSKDHKPYLEEERQRIISNGGMIAGNYMVSRTGEALAVSRAVGDISFRRPPNDFLISNPTMAQFERTPEDDFFVLASDGLYDVMTNQDVCDFVLSCLEDGLHIDTIAERLTSEAVARGSMDNVTVILVCFLDPKTGAPKHASHAAELNVTSSQYSKLHEAKASESMLRPNVHTRDGSGDLVGLEIETDNSEHYE